MWWCQFIDWLQSGAGENTLRRLALFLYKDHPPKFDVTSGKKAGWAAKIKFECDTIVLSVSKMAIFRNRLDMFNVFLGHGKQNFVVFLVISFVWGTEGLFIQNHAVLKACVFTKCRRFFFAEIHGSHRLHGNNEFYVSCTQFKYPILLGRYYTKRKAQCQFYRRGRTYITEAHFLKFILDKH